MNQAIRKLIELYLTGSLILSLFMICPATAKAQTGNVEIKSLQKYRQQLNDLRNEFRVYEMPDVKFFLFGMGNRTKILYKDGNLINAITGKTIKEWKFKSETIVPNGSN
jgi:hypothetical protein